MSLWNKTFTSIGSLTQELNSTNSLWCIYGKIESIEVVNRDPLLEGSVVLYAQTVGNRIRNTERYALKLSKLLSLDFSSVLPGLSVYLSESASHSLGGWNSLSQEQQDAYSATGNSLYLNGKLIPAWPLSTSLPFVSDIYIEEFSGGQIVSGGVLSFPSTSITENLLKTVTIKNRGPQVLRLTNTPKVVLTGVNSADYIIGQPSISSLLEDESTSFTVDFIPTVSGVSIAQILIPNNDPEDGGFIINVSGIAANKKAGSIDLLYSENSLNSSDIEFYARPIGSTSSQRLVFKNSGNAEASIVLTSISSDWSTSFTQDTIDAAGEIDFSVDFSPTVSGSVSGTLTVSGTLNDEIDFNTTYNLIGYGY
jgi:hypothetical protein